MTAPDSSAAAMADTTAELTAQLAEALETIRAIRHGEVDALVVADPSSTVEVFTLSSADRPYRLFVDSMRDGAATVSGRGVILYANQKLATMLRTPVAEVVGAELTSFVPARHHAALLAQDGRSEASSAIDIEVHAGLDRTLWARVNASALDVDGEQMVCLTFADLSGIRANEAALARAHEQALEALRLRSLFVANMSHEIRTPLYGVVGMTDLMLGTVLTEEQREYADGVRASADALMSVVDQVLDFSKLDSGNVQLEDVPFSPLVVLEEACSMVGAAALAKGVELLSSVEGPLPDWVSGDCTRLRQVLINLMSNAVKFTEAGHVCTTVSATEEPGGWRLAFTVSDTGIGVSVAATEHIFDSFSQADGSTTRRYGGTGLGLAICKQLVDLMGGEIGVESDEGAGSAFWFTLRTGVVVDGPPSDPPLAALSGRVLVVDDNDRSRLLLIELLSGWGLSCLAAADGAEALEVCRQAATAGPAVQLVLLDNDMPGMSTPELAEALMPLPLVMMMSSQRQRDDARSAGVRHFVSKPIRQRRLHAALSEALVAEVALSTQPPPSPFPRLLGPDLERPQPQSSQRQRILLVEDNEVNQLVGVRMIEKRGFDVDVAANGQVALEMSAERDYLVIFLDCQMPVLDGYQTAAKIRRREGPAEHVPIVAMTANTIKGDREKCLASGMDDYLGKPFTGQALDAAIARALDMRQGDDPEPEVATVGRNPAPAVLDPAALEELCLGDDAIRTDLVDMFLAQCSAAADELAAALERDDGQRLFSEAHHLKGSAGSLGALLIAEVSGQLCAVGRSGGLEQAGPLLAEFRAALELTERALGAAGAAQPGGRSV